MPTTMLVLGFLYKSRILHERFSLNGIQTHMQIQIKIGFSQQLEKRLPLTNPKKAKHILNVI